jgi:hypothetical protein
VNRAVLVSVLLLVVGGAAVWIFATRPPARTPDESNKVQADSANDGDQASAPRTDGPLMFRAAGLPFRYERGDSGLALPVEPVGGGVGVADFDANGTLDLFFAQGSLLPLGRSAGAEPDALVRNLGARQFEDVSHAARLTSTDYGIGVAVADFDADGFPDVYVTRYGRNTLYHNEADGSFRDVTESAGVGCSLWSLGAAFADFDNDGDLDLFVANYFSFDPAAAPFARDPVTGAAEYGAPARFDGEPDVLYRNDGDGRFSDVTREAGIDDTGRGMGVLATDFDGDGRVDILVANDAQNNALWHNRGGRFKDVALEWGVAVNARGEAEANMGIAYGDTDGNGAPDVLISHLVNEHDTLWRARATPSGVLFRDETIDAGLGLDSRRLTGWGTAFGDFDHDGLLDLIVVNGHIKREPNQPLAYANPPTLWHGAARGRFVNVTATAGPYFVALHQARGLAAGDLDDDDRLDLVVVHHGEPSTVLWNESPLQGHNLLVRLRGATENRDAIGARVTATIGDRTLVRTRDGGGSYVSTSDARLHFGLGDATQVDRLEVRWPSGITEARADLAADNVVSLNEGRPK